jgi:hypothetical protein
MSCLRIHLRIFRYYLQGQEPGYATYIEVPYKYIELGILYCNTLEGWLSNRYALNCVITVRL